MQKKYFLFSSTKVGRVIRILNDYGLFEMHDLTFRSTRPGEWMRLLEDKRKAMDTTPCGKRRTTVPQSSDDQATNARRNPCNPLIINDTLDIVEYSRVEKSIVEKTSSPKPSSSKMDDDGGAGEPQVPGRSQAVHAGKRSEAGAVAYRPYPTCPGRKKNT